MNKLCWYMHVIYIVCFNSVTSSSFTFDLNKLPIKRRSFLRNWTFYNETLKSLFGCYNLCAQYAGCESVNYFLDTFDCNLNLKRPSDAPNDVTIKNNAYCISKGDLDQDYMPPCRKKTCEYDQICYEVGNAALCIKNESFVYSTVFWEESGFIESMKYPSMYPRYLTQEFRIVGPIGSRITLTFIEFKTESNFDKLTIQDGPDSSHKSMGVFSGSLTPSPMTSSQSNVWMRFHTDLSTETKGFKIQYKVTMS